MCFWFLLFSGHTSLPFSTVKQLRLCIHKYYVLCTSRSINQHVLEITAQDYLVIWYEEVPELLLKLFSYSPCQSLCSQSPALSSCVLCSFASSPHISSPLILSCLFSSPCFVSCVISCSLSFSICLLSPPILWPCLLSSLASSLILLCIYQVS